MELALRVAVPTARPSITVPFPAVMRIRMVEAPMDATRPIAISPITRPLLEVEVSVAARSLAVLFPATIPLDPEEELIITPHFTIAHSPGTTPAMAAARTLAHWSIAYWSATQQVVTVVAPNMAR